MVSRGLKPTPYQNPATTLGAPTVVLLPEYKEVAPQQLESGICLFTCHVRRGAPDVQDPAWNSHSKLNCIAACIQVGTQLYQLLPMKVGSAKNDSRLRRWRKASIAASATEPDAVQDAP